MPSSSRPPSCSGCGRRLDSNRRTRASSLDSRNRILRSTPAGHHLGHRRRELVEQAAAADVDHDGDPVDIGACGEQRQGGGSIIGGRLSMTNQPRSSRARAALERPAPDIPDTSSSSKPAIPSPRASTRWSSRRSSFWGAGHRVSCGRGDILAHDLPVVRFTPGRRAARPVRRRSARPGRADPGHLARPARAWRLAACAPSRNWRAGPCAGPGPRPGMASRALVVIRAERFWRW